MAPLKKILVPVDFSPCSLAAVETAIELSSRLGATFELLHVFEPPPVYGPDALVVGGAALYSELEDHGRRMAGKRMDQLVEQLRARGLHDVRARVELGVPAVTILDLAEKDSFDLIVMGTHGRTGMSRFLAGSVAEKVVRLSPIPVMTIRHPDEAGQVSLVVD